MSRVRITCGILDKCPKPEGCIVIALGVRIQRTRTTRRIPLIVARRGIGWPRTGSWADSQQYTTQDHNRLVDFAIQRDLLNRW